MDMKMMNIINNNLRTIDSEELQDILLMRVIKLRKLDKEMNEDPRVQKAHDALELARAPYKKTRSKWKSEIDAIELELKSRNIKFNISTDDIYEEIGDDN